MKRFNKAFQTKLYDAIKDIEDNSQIEVVVLIKPQSGSYRDLALWAGVLFSFSLFTFFMFSPFEFDMFSIYVFTILGFFAIYTLLMALPELMEKAIPDKREKRNVEIFARASFQKGGLRFTNNRIGTLIYFSLFEKKVFVLPDRGAEMAVPADDWEKINAKFQAVFSSDNVPEALLKALADCKPVFSAFIPSVENDVNELADDLNIDL
jgi:putative membrane protein